MYLVAGCPRITAINKHEEQAAKRVGMSSDVLMVGHQLFLI